MPRYWFWLLLLVPPIVQAAAPSQEFWEYMADYSDENGEVLDPLELDEAIAAREQGGFGSEQIPKASSAPVESGNLEPGNLESGKAPSDKSTLEQGRMKNADLKAVGKSSATNASRKGATL